MYSLDLIISYNTCHLLLIFLQIVYSLIRRRVLNAPSDQGIYSLLCRLNATLAPKGLNVVAFRNSEFGFSVNIRQHSFTRMLPNVHGEAKITFTESTDI